MYDEAPTPPPKPRFGGRTPAIIGLSMLLISIGVFVVVLGAIGVNNGPFSGDKQLPPANTHGASPSPSSARFAEAGTCVANMGTDANPELQVVGCTPGALEVLKRFDGTSDVTVCEGVAGYRYHYFFDSELPGLDFVLCIGIRP